MMRSTTTQIARWVGGELVGDERSVTGCSIDSRQVEAGMMYVALAGERVDGHAFITHAQRNGASGAIVERQRQFEIPPGFPVIYVDETLRALSDLASGWRERITCPVVGVTGSNGKTTVKEMLTAIFRRCGRTHSTPGNLNNHIGVPLTILGMDVDDQFAVVEMGANHPGEIAALSRLAQPQVGVITLCAPAHLEGFESIDGVARAKGEIYEALPDDGVAVINADDAYAPMWRKLAGARRHISFGLNAGADVCAKAMKLDGQGARFTVVTEHEQREVRLPLAGEHNVCNALGAIAAALGCGVSLDQAILGLGTVEPVPGRLQPRRGLAGATIIDDTYNANPSSLKAGLEVLNTNVGERWLVLGDMAELGGDERDYHREAGALAKRSGVSRLYGCGPLSQEAVVAFGSSAKHFDCRSALQQSLRADLKDCDAGPVTVLVKGSRSAGMEAVVDAIVEQSQVAPCC